ncbi:hypothetical protein I7I48_09784 [Histoplasma ohiense]|nr:hypothetical protein I7I48_09784 [Histoplasma ohiense (nom. inval.)]
MQTERSHILHPFSPIPQILDMDLRCISFPCPFFLFPTRQQNVARGHVWGVNTRSRSAQQTGKAERYHSQQNGTLTKTPHSFRPDPPILPYIGLSFRPTMYNILIKDQKIQTLTRCRNLTSLSCRWALILIS